MAEPRAGVLYADTSALAKLIVREAESEALESALVDWPELATSAITAIELTRAVARARTEADTAVADDWVVLGVLAAAAEIPLTDDIRATASTLAPVELRTLDAIHLASALTQRGPHPDGARTRRQHDQQHPAHTDRRTDALHVPRHGPAAAASEPQLPRSGRYSSQNLADHAGSLRFDLVSS